MARRSESLPMVKLVLELDNCSGCPFVNVHRTLIAGFALDYFCGHPSKKDYSLSVKEGLYRPEAAVGPEVMGYVEGASDHEEIPDWCPIRLEPAPKKEYKGIGDGI